MYHSPPLPLHPFAIIALSGMKQNRFPSVQWHKEADCVKKYLKQNIEGFLFYNISIWYLVRWPSDILIVLLRLPGFFPDSL